MKVNIYITEDITDEERKQISELLGVRQASRDQLKEFMWTNGESWRSKLNGAPAPEPADDDLI
jgi:hypothetical protein